ncbi:MAG TPA: cytochrome o ubiquinol oxidase subunit I, partial [Candidatus Saccharimonadia bacterium]|nr:cytochrome o ubiquinol oxidase subunit I [Candidatus Saccharimonadia bacterium]
RTLEWSTKSPAPFYNFAVIPDASERDAWWAMKESGHTKPAKSEYKDIHMPKNTMMGMVIAAFAFAFGFGFIWHMWWLAIVGLAGAIVSVIIKTSDDNSEYVITAAELERMDS